MTRTECPGCGSHETEQMHVEFWADEVEEVRACRACGVEYEVVFGDPLKEVIREATDA